MADNIKGSETEQNLLKVFAIESQLRNKFDFYARIAEIEGFDYIKKFFDRTSLSQREHAKLWHKWLNFGKAEHTADVLEDVVKGKYSGLGKYYDMCAQKAQEEGFQHIADLFRHISEVEKSNQAMFKKLLASVKDDHIQPDKDGNYRWECSVCGAYFDQKEIPDHCPLCLNEDIFFFKRPFDETGEN